MFEFAWPWLWLLFPLPLAIYFLLPQAERQSAALRVPFGQYLANTPHTPPKKTIKSPWRLLILTIIWLLLIASAAKPQWLGEPVELPASGRDLLVAVDISGSMETADMTYQGKDIARVVVMKYVVGEFLKRRENDRLGLVLFGSNAYLQTPLTFDRETVNQMLQESQLGFAGQKTAIGDAIGLSVKHLKDRPDSHRVLILLTDGANTAGEVSPRQAADLAAQAGVKIYTIGMGASEKIIRSGFFGNRRINPSADLDEDTLKYIAETTGGQYFRARDPQELQEIYTYMDKLEPIEQDSESFRPLKALYQWPLGLALGLSLSLAFVALWPSIWQGFNANTYKNL